MGMFDWLFGRRSEKRSNKSADTWQSGASRRAKPPAGAASGASRRVLVFRDFKNKVGLIVGEQFMPTPDDVVRLSKGARFKGIEKVRTATADGKLEDDNLICITLSFQLFGHPPGDGYYHEFIDLNQLP